jgi:hypothetical protein
MFEFQTVLRLHIHTCVCHARCVCVFLLNCRLHNQRTCLRSLPYRKCSDVCRRLLRGRGSAGVTCFFSVFLDKVYRRTTYAMQALKKAAKAVGSNKVHPTESQDADSEMVQPPRRRRQSRDITVAGNDSFMPPSILKIGSSKNAPELRRPSFSLDAKHSPTARASPTLTSFRRRSLSNGSIGSETAGLREPGSGRDAAHSPAPPSSIPEDKNGIPAPRKDIQQIQSLALQRFFTSAENSNSWSAASKKMIFGSDIDDAKLQNRSKLENRRVPSQCSSRNLRTC